MLLKMASATSTAGTRASAHSMLVRLLGCQLGWPEGDGLDADAEEGGQALLAPPTWSCQAALPLVDGARLHPTPHRQVAL